MEPGLVGKEAGETIPVSSGDIVASNFAESGRSTALALGGVSAGVQQSRTSAVTSASASCGSTAWCDASDAFAS
jgi:hypothetical protein